jgi:diguanylate cyclase (GGDEF)-like protein
VSQDVVLLGILGVAILANVLLLALIPRRMRADTRALQLERLAAARPVASATSAAARAASATSERTLDQTRGDRPNDDDARAVAAVEAFVAEGSEAPDRRASHPATTEGTSRRRDPVPATAPAPTGPKAMAVSGQARDVSAPSAASTRTPSAASRPVQPVQAPRWGVVGLGDPGTWEQTMREESARAARFRRPVTVVMVELSRIGDVVDRLGQGAADRVVTETARLIVAEGRAVDRIAWLDYARFGVLLMETEEDRATDYIDRVRAAADGWLQSAGLSVRVSVGWASPPEGGDVEAAAAIAEQRMRQPDPRHPDQVPSDPES